MRAVRTRTSNRRYELSGGTDANVLPARVGDHAGADGIVAPGDPTYHLPYLLTTWVPSDDERAAIAVGRNLELVILGGSLPPLALGVTDEGPVDEPEQAALDDPCVWLRMAEPLAQDVLLVLRSVSAQAEASKGAGEEPTEEALASLERLDVLRGMLEHYTAELQRQRADLAGGIAEAIREGNVLPWVGEGADGCRRSAQVAADELATLARDDERRPRLEAARQAWLDRAKAEEEPDA